VDKRTLRLKREGIYYFFRSSL